MSDLKLTASVLSVGGQHIAQLRIGVQVFTIMPVYREDRDEKSLDSAQYIADMLTKAIAKHDAALLAQRDKLLAVCREMAVWFTDFDEDADLVEWLENFPLSSLEAAIAEVENYDV